MLYNPFKKAIEEVNYDDLLGLIENKTSEGWCIEYKGILPLLKNGRLDNNRLCKTVSAFANTEGGYLIYGIECDNKNFQLPSKVLVWNYSKTLKINCHK